MSCRMLPWVKASGFRVRAARPPLVSFDRHVRSKRLSPAYTNRRQIRRSGHGHSRIPARICPRFLFLAFRTGRDSRSKRSYSVTVVVDDDDDDDDDYDGAGGMRRTCPSVIRLPGSYKLSRILATGHRSEKLASRPRRFVTRAASEPSRAARLRGTVVQGGCGNDTSRGPLASRSHVWGLESVGRYVRDCCTRFHDCAGPSARDERHADSVRVNVRRMCLLRALRPDCLTSRLLEFLHGMRVRII